MTIRTYKDIVKPRVLGIGVFELIGKKCVFCLLALLGTLGSHAKQVNAATASKFNYAFSVTIENGFYAGTRSYGTFSYLDTVFLKRGVAALPSRFIGSGLLYSLSFECLGRSYTEENVDTGFLHINADGKLHDFLIGSNCNLGGCGLNILSTDWSRGGRTKLLLYRDGVVTDIGSGNAPLEVYFTGIDQVRIPSIDIPAPSIALMTGLFLLASTGFFQRRAGRQET